MPPIYGPENYDLEHVFDLDSIVMSSTAKGALFAYFLVIFLLFAALKRRHAILASYQIGYMFLPMGFIELPGPFGEFNKYWVMNYGVLAALVVFDTRKLLSYRPKLTDIPWLMMMGCPLVSDLANGTSGARALMSAITIYFVPYLCGRLYFSTIKDLRTVAYAMMIGALVYAPLCLFESAFSPVMHLWVYGYIQHEIAQHWRLGGWRPMLFMYHGLMVAPFMFSATFLAVYHWKRGAVKTVLPGKAAVCLLVWASFGMRSMGAMSLAVVNFAVFWFTQSRKSLLPLLIFASLLPAYGYVRMSGLVTGETFLKFLAEEGNARQQESVTSRFTNENLTMANVKSDMKHFLVGFGLGGGHIVDEQGNHATIIDSEWILKIGRLGIVGFTAWLAFWWLPMFRTFKYSPHDIWTRPDLIHIPVMALIVTYYQSDNFQNSMYSPLVYITVGALTHVYYPRYHPTVAQVANWFAQALAPTRTLGAEALLARAEREWGPNGLARREALLTPAGEGFTVAEREQLEIGLRRALLTLPDQHLKTFLRLPPVARRQVAYNTSLPLEAPPLERAPVPQAAMAGAS